MNIAARKTCAMHFKWAFQVGLKSAVNPCSVWSFKALGGLFGADLVKGEEKEMRRKMHILNLAFTLLLTGEISNHECTVSCSVLPATSMPLMSTLRRNEHSTAFTENLILTEKPEKIPNYFPNLFRLLIGFLLQWRDIREKVSTRLYVWPVFTFLSHPSALAKWSSGRTQREQTK